jgi:hypothetical protein
MSICAMCALCESNMIYFSAWQTVLGAMRLVMSCPYFYYPKVIRPSAGAPSAPPLGEGGVMTRLDLEPTQQRLGPSRLLPPALRLRRLAPDRGPVHREGAIQSGRCAARALLGQGARRACVTTWAGTKSLMRPRMVTMSSRLLLASGGGGLVARVSRSLRADAR